MSADRASRDSHLLALFIGEAEGRLASLGIQLIDLEEQGGSPELIASLFRDAHTLKGSAALLGLDGITKASHAMEDVLQQLRAGEIVPTPELIDRLLHQVDEVRALVAAAATASPTTADLMAASPTASSPVPAGEDSVRSPAAGAAGPATATGAGSQRPPAPAMLQVPTSRIDDLVRLIGEARSAELRLEGVVARALRSDPAEVTEFRDVSRVLRDIESVAMKARMVRVATLEPRLHRAVRETARSAGKKVRWEMRGEDAELDRAVLEHVADPLLHLVRNAVDHGIEPPAERRRIGKPEQGNIRLHAMQLGPEVVLAVTDDGRGIDVGVVREAAGNRDSGATTLSDEDALYLIFRSGVSTASSVTEVSGRGVGLDVVRSGVASIRGRIEVHSTPGQGSEFRISVPITVATLRCLIVVAGGQRFAIPMHAVLTIQPPGAHSHVGGWPTVLVRGQAVPITPLDRLLGIDSDDREGPLVVVAGLTRTHAFEVDAVTGQRDVVVKPISTLVPALEILTGATAEADGRVLLVLDVGGMIDRARHEYPRRGSSQPPTPDTIVHDDRPTILVVDDALTVRELQRSILEDAGYVVRTASDGAEAMAVLAEGRADLVLSDVEMPRMDGFELTSSIRAHPQLATIPVLLITSRGGEEDRRRGLDVGANGYIVKSAFDQSSLLAAVERLLGRRE